MNNNQAKHLGQELVKFLNLKPLPNGGTADIRYATDWGTKTLEGLGRCVERMVQDAEKKHPNMEIRNTLIRSVDINDR